MTYVESLEWSRLWQAERKVLQFSQTILKEKQQRWGGRGGEGEREQRLGSSEVRWACLAEITSIIQSPNKIKTKTITTKKGTKVMSMSLRNTTVSGIQCNVTAQHATMWLIAKCGFEPVTPKCELCGRDTINTSAGGDGCVIVSYVCLSWCICTEMSGEHMLRSSWR